jgi:hypothetical protein
MRRVTARVTDGSGTTFTISPAWDVVPTTASLLTIGNSFWQVLTLGNVVDNRAPLCRKSNANGLGGGSLIQWGGPVVESVLARNVQYDSDGIWLNLRYFAEDPAAPGWGAQVITQWFVEVRDNQMLREYAEDLTLHSGGIFFNLGASPTPTYPPPSVGYGVVVAHNTVVHADGGLGSAIEVASSGACGPPPTTWKLQQHTLLFHNLVQDLPTGGAVNLATACIWNTVLYNTTLTNVLTPLTDSGSGTVLYRPMTRRPVRHILR